MFNPKDFKLKGELWEQLVKDCSRNISLKSKKLRGSKALFVAKNKESNAISFRLSPMGVGDDRIEVAIYDCTIQDILDGAIDAQYVEISHTEHAVLGMMQQHCF